MLNWEFLLRGFFGVLDWMFSCQLLLGGLLLGLMISADDLLRGFLRVDFFSGKFFIGWFDRRG